MHDKLIFKLILYASGMLSLPRVGSTAARVLTTVGKCRVVYSTAQSRGISSRDHIFNSTTNASIDVPAMPLPPSVPSLDELIESGQSVLSELGLISWWKPSSYFRMALEGIHMHADVPWWLTIVSATVVLRLALISVPIMSQRLVAKQSMYKKELDEFRERTEEARKEGNNLLTQQIFLEQRDFLKAKDIRLGRQFVVLLANGGVFMTQFFAIKRMIEVNYPGFSTGGALWFTDLTLADPYYVLPFISAATMALVSRVGIEMGTSSDSMAPAMRLGMLYGLPVIIFAVSSQFGSGLCVYWCASNLVSLSYSLLFRIDAVRKLLKIPPIVKHNTVKKNPWNEIMTNYRASKQVPPSISDLKTRDAEKFKKAGRGKPML